MLSDLLAEDEGVEPPRRVNDLSVFKTDPVSVWVILLIFAPDASDAND